MPEPTPTSPGPDPTPPADKPEPVPYELAPAPPPAPPAPSKLSDKGLTEDFPEDADFTHDPEVEQALKGEKPKDKAKDDTVDEKPEPQPPLVKPGMGDAKAISLVGLGLAIAAVIAAGLNAEHHWFWQAALALYIIIVHSLTGLGAVAATAHINEQPMGPPELAAGRMLTAVSLFMFLLNVHVTPQFVAAIVAIGGYYLAITILFRAPSGRLLMIAIMHALAAILVWLGMAIYGWAAPPAAQ
jgi:hypothetical protein